MDDYCKSCVEQCGCGRWDTLTEPDVVECSVTSDALRMVAAYRCPNGHGWTTRFTQPLHPNLIS